MKLVRLDNGDVVYKDEKDKEIHPYITVLAVIEQQLKAVPPKKPELTPTGWNVVIEALELAINSLSHTKPAEIVVAEKLEEVIEENNSDIPFVMPEPSQVIPEKSTRKAKTSVKF